MTTTFLQSKSSRKKFTSKIALKIALKTLSLVVLQLYSLTAFAEKSFEAQVESLHSCLKLVTASDATKTGLTELRRITGGLGMSESRFGTTIYYSPVNNPRKGFPQIADDAKAIVIGFGGSGVMTASGRTFTGDSHVFKRYGVNVISFDYPFHANGPTEKKFLQIAEFKKMVFSIINHFKKTGLPIYLMGHSMGPSVVQEILFESPAIAKGALMLSPGGTMGPESREHYRGMETTGRLNATLQMNFEINDAGETWELAMDQGFLSNKSVKMKTTIPVRFIAGDQDHWNTPEILHLIAGRYSNSTVEIVPGAGHAIFAVKGTKERLPIERMLSLISEVEGIELTADHLEKNTPTVELLVLYNNSSVFRNWMKNVVKKPFQIVMHDPFAAVGLLNQWQLWMSDWIYNLARNRYPDLKTAPPRVAEILKKKSTNLTQNDIGPLMDLFIE